MDSEYAPRPDYDPLFIHSRREAIFIFLLWLSCLLWCVPYCYMNGYVPAGEEVEILWGLPRWIVMGVLGPWMVANVITFLFCAYIFREDELGESPDESPHEDSPESTEDSSVSTSRSSEGAS